TSLQIAGLARARLFDRFQAVSNAMGGVKQAAAETKANYEKREGTDEHHRHGLQPRVLKTGIYLPERIVHDSAWCKVKRPLCFGQPARNVYLRLNLKFSHMNARIAATGGHGT